MTSSLNTPKLEIACSRHFTSWLGEQQISLATTTYQAGKLFLFGRQDDGRLSTFERTFSRCMGMCSDGQSIWMTSLFQLWRFENALDPGQNHNGYDALYVPQVGYTTGDLDIHDVAVDHEGNPVFVNTLFSCLSTVSNTHSFKPIWQPPFITKLAAEERCHLNGLAMENGRPRYVTAVSDSDVADGWRDHRQSGGVVVDVQSNETITHGLSMPHSPRVYRDQLWVLNAGTGYFGLIDELGGEFEPLTFCPGFLRGLSFIGDYAIVTTSKPRDNKTHARRQLEQGLYRCSLPNLRDRPPHIRPCSLAAI